MPRSKTGKRRPHVSQENLVNAINAMQHGASYKEASSIYHISLATLYRYYKQHRLAGDEDFHFNPPRYKVKQVFSEAEELLLVNYLKQAARLHYGLTKKALQELAYQFAKAKNDKIPTQWETAKQAGKGWVRIFLNKYKNDLALRKPEGTSLARSTSFNKVNVDLFFNKLTEVMTRHGSFSPEQIYNCDETGVTTVHVPPKVLAPKGIKQIGSMTSGERGVNVTLICSVNAIGNHVPPLLIFPRVNYKLHMIKGAPPGTIGDANPSGWSNEIIFLRYMDHLVNTQNHQKKNLWVMDNHDSHVNIPVINKARQNNIVLLTFPPHTSHKLQPLDRTVFGPLKNYYNRACEEWMLANPGKPLSIYEIAEMVGKSYPRAFTSSNIMSGFKVTGICPLNSDVFEEHEFLSSYVTDRPDPSIPVKQVIANAIPSTSTSHSADPIPTNDVLPITPEMIRPFPKAAPRIQSSSSRGRRKGKTRILTDSPEKNEIEQQKTPKSSKVRATKRQLLQESSSSSSEEEDIVSERSDEEVDDEIEEFEKENDFIKIIDCKVQKGDFVLTKFATKKSVVYYVAEIMTALRNTYEVKYLKRFLKTNKFVYDKDQELYEIEKQDIAKVLPKPCVVGGTARREEQLYFNVDFSSTYCVR